MIMGILSRGGNAPRIFILLSLLLLCAASITLAGCTEQDSGAASLPPTDGPRVVNESVAKIEVLHFHPAHQCTSCIVLGDYAEETVKTYFAPELASGKMVFAHVNGELAENRALVEKYGVTSSSLWIGVYADGQFSKEENINVWYKLNKKQDFMDYLKGILEKRLAGDFS
jgi:hypothetical protein